MSMIQWEIVGSMKVILSAFMIRMHVGDCCSVECLTMRFFFSLMGSRVIVIESVVTADHISLFTAKCNQNLCRENM